MRYLSLTDQDRAAMLKAIGVPTVDAFYDGVPEQARLTRLDDLPDHAGELEVERALTRLASRNRPASAGPSFLGAGLYRHHVPAAVDALIQRGEFLTAYTPYQPEISQGTLHMLFEFQTQVALLLGLEIANASMYDGASAAAEAALMARRITRRDRVVLSGALHPHYRATIETYMRYSGGIVESLAPDVRGAENAAKALDQKTACLVVQNPGFYGQVRDLKPLAQAAHDKGALLVCVVTEAVSLGLIASPGEMDADIVAAEGQSFGNALSFGGPTVGLFATREKYLRQMPGRLCGETLDADGRRGYVLTLSAREQHIRREKATSNICTNSGLCALAFSIHVSLLGEAGLKRLARLNHEAAMRAAERLAAVPGVEVVNDTFFNEFTLRLKKPAAPIVEALAARGVLAGVPVSRLEPRRAELADLLLVAASEMTTEEEIAELAEKLAEALR